MKCPEYEKLRLTDIACECHSQFVNTTKHISKKRCSTEENYDIQSLYYEREKVVASDNSSGKVCVIYKKKVNNVEDNQEVSNISPEETTISYIPDEKTESCYPHKIKRKEGHCSAALYPYEIIRKIPFDDICKCNENKINDNPEDHLEGFEDQQHAALNTKTDNTKQKTSSSLKSGTSLDQTKKSSLKKGTKLSRFTKRLKNLTTSSIISEDACNCFPDLNCQCPKTGEYKVLKSEYEERKERPVKTKYIAKPCMQTYFNRCQIEGDVLDNATIANNENQKVYLDSGTTCFYNNVPCCTCPKPDPDPDHPSYLSTKVNVTDLMKQLLTFHFNRSYMTQYYSRVQMDNVDAPCEICQDKITQAVGCVGSCCKCPKPNQLKSCKCPESSESEYDSTSEDEQVKSKKLDKNNTTSAIKEKPEVDENKIIDFNKKCKPILENLLKQTPTSHNKCDCSNITNYHCYNVMCNYTHGNNQRNLCSHCNLLSQKFLRSQNEHRIEDTIHCGMQHRNISRSDEPVREESNTQSLNYEVDPLRKRNMFKGFFSKMKLDWPKRKSSLKSIVQKAN